ncbi:chorion peroxidase-like [Gigantopelta aegis]|uniref:chorion peroxidase-like n=1 Tax=Gigantopelta aegis TaxID=1735272 RepID=UPI001B889352|nr:chorion peroxidase-like [Gigantopelta aegis]
MFWSVSAAPMTTLALLGLFLVFTRSTATMDEENNIQMIEHHIIGVSGMKETKQMAFIHIPYPSYCDSADKYRSIDGSCNNLLKLQWGMLGRPFRRFLPQSYDDGVSKPRFFQRDGRILPSARLVSTNCHSEGNEGELRDHNLSLLFMQWGQFVDHDITATAEEEEVEDCCEGLLPDGKHNHYHTGGPCFPIPIPKTDPHFKRKCMDFLRSMPDEKGHKSHREQMNMITAYMDASQIYGSSVKEMNDLRTFNLGLLRTSASNQLPRGKNIHRPCKNETEAPNCLTSGDVRVNEVPGLTGLHTLFHKLHNRIVRILKRLNQHWNDEHLFQEARKINGAILQHITYKHWLPIVLGPGGMRQSRISWRYRYQPTLRAEVFNSFATAAFRFGHSLVPREFKTSVSDHTLVDTMFFRPYFLKVNNSRGLYSIMDGMVSRPCSRPDRFLTTGLTNHLYETIVPPMDLAARNVQRGRDHGLPPYSQYRRLLRRGSPRVQLSRKCLETYNNNYDEVDLFVGGLTEKPYNGGVVGPTFGFIIGQQFYNLKNGDRFWYENKNYRTRLTAEQLRYIKRMTLSRVMCDVLDLEAIQQNAFRMVSKSNPKVRCSDSSIPYLDLSAWKD